MKNKKINKILSSILVIFILIQPFLDIYIFFDEAIVNKYHFSPSTIIRLSFIFTITILFLFTYKSKKSYLIYGSYILLIIAYTFGHLYYCKDFYSLFPNNFSYSIISEIFYIIRMVIPLVLIIVTNEMKYKEKSFLKTINILVLLIAGSIVITNFLGVSLGAYSSEIKSITFFDWFSGIYDKGFTFYDTATKSWFTFANLISNMLVMLTPIIYYQLYKSSSLKIILIIFIQLLSTFMLGTKIATFGFLIITVTSLLIYLFFTILKKEYKFNYRVILIIIIFIILWFFIYPYSPAHNREYLTNQQNNQTIKNIDIKDKIVKDYESYSKYHDKDENKEMLIELIEKNLDIFPVKELLIYETYSYKYDPYFWYKMIKNNYTSLSNTRFVTEQILIRVSDINNSKMSNYFGISFSRMSNIYNLERDFLSQYYSLGIFGIICVLPYALLAMIFGIKILILYKNKFNSINIMIMFSISTGLLGAYFSGNTLDNLTFSIVLSYICGYMMSRIYNNNDNKIELKENKVTILALHLGVGGVEKYISSLCKMLEEKYNIEIISTYKVLEKPVFDFSNKIEIKYLINDRPYKNEFIISLRKFNIINIIKYGFKNFIIILKKYILELNSISIIDSKYVITTRFHSKKVGNLLSSDYIKIATEHNYHNNNKMYIRKIVSSVKNFNYLVCVSKELSEFYSKKIKTTCRSIFIPNTIDNIPNIKYRKNNNLLISVGRLSKEKGFLDLIDIISLVKKEKENILLNIVGSGPEEKTIKNKISELNLEKNINLLGTINHDNINHEMQKANIYLMTSFTESFGLVLIEAMSNKLCCISFDSSNGAKYLLGKNRGILIKNRNKEEMAKQIIKILDNEKERIKIENIGFEYCQKFLIKNVKYKWFDLLKNNSVKMEDI